MKSEVVFPVTRNRVLRTLYDINQHLDVRSERNERTDRKSFK